MMTSDARIQLDVCGEKQQNIIQKSCYTSK